MGRDWGMEYCIETWYTMKIYEEQGSISLRHWNSACRSCDSRRGACADGAPRFRTCGLVRAALRIHRTLLVESDDWRVEHRKLFEFDRCSGDQSYFYRYRCDLRHSIRGNDDYVRRR